MVLKFKSISQFMRIPACCPLCQQLHCGKYILCINCQNSLQTLPNPCSCCAFPLADQYPGVCGRCIKKPPAFDKVFSHYQFDESMRLLLHRYKYQQALYLRDYLAHMIAEAKPEAHPLPECLIPVPLHPKRLQERGFNQSAELAKRLGKRYGLPVETSLCRKIKHTPPQVTLNSDARRSNLSQAFSCNPSPYRHIAVIDDLLTTGSTVEALARMLKKNGIKRVDVWCCARTVS